MLIKFTTIKAPHVTQPFVGDGDVQWHDYFIEFNLQGYSEVDGWDLEKTVGEIVEGELWFIVDGDRRPAGFFTEYVHMHAQHPTMGPIALLTRVVEGKVKFTILSPFTDWVQARSDFHLFAQDWDNL